MPTSSRRAKRAVYAVETTANPKLGLVSATYVAQQTCPDSCPFLDHGCFAQNGFLGGNIVKPLNRGVATEMTRLEIAQQEANMIDGLSGERDLRLHVVGDSTTTDGTRALAAAARRYSSKHGRAVWTYSHGWRSLSRKSWGSISVLASCETTGDIADARRRGYATAIVVPEHRTKRLYRVGRAKILPCPEQTSGVSCADCRLCMRDDYLHDAGITIAFAAHGSVGSKAKAIAALAAAAVPNPKQAKSAA